MIPVTKPFLQPQKAYSKYLDGIWHRNWLTNMGPLDSELEVKLKDYLQVNHILCVTNGTVALQIAIKALDLKGEIITTIFEFGDIPVCSLHATKLYHSIEGGLIITKDPVSLKKLAYIRNFGYDGPVAFAKLCINGKNSEFHAAMKFRNLIYK
jgi:dTDP-4-amino-4,6-dideoxygalactose transaminase